DLLESAPTVDSSTDVNLRSMTVASNLRRDNDLLEAGGWDIVVKLHAGFAPEVAGDQLGERLAHDPADRVGLVAPAQSLQCVPDPRQRVLDGLTQRGADGQRVVEPLAKDAKIAALDLIDLEALPESLVEIAEVVNPPGSEVESLADSLRGADDAFSR